jgi:protein-L-isoaspartate(D-aspartate) O-methyltransferase
MMRKKSRSAERKKMVENQIARRGIRDPRVLEVFKTVPRHRFVPDEYQSEAYDDCPLPIGFGQTISQPYIVALMTSNLGLKGEEKVLEIGTGSGYQAAILSQLAEEVHTVEFIPELAKRAEALLDSYQNVHTHLGDGSIGWLDEAPYDGILVTAAAPQTPKPLLEQLVDNGCMVIPVGGRGFQRLEIWQRQGASFHSEGVINVAFVPLRGEEGWDRKTP